MTYRYAPSLRSFLLLEDVHCFSNFERSTFTLCKGYQPYSTPAQCLCLSSFLLVETSTFNVQRSLFASDLDNIVRRANACASLSLTLSVFRMRVPLELVALPSMWSPHLVIYCWEVSSFSALVLLQLFFDHVESLKVWDSVSLTIYRATVTDEKSAGSPAVTFMILHNRTLTTHALPRPIYVYRMSAAICADCSTIR